MAVDAALPSFILGYHGCDQETAEKLFSGETTLKVSQQDYNWLGDGIYFWEHNAQRAYDWARQVCDNPHPSGQKINTPAVIGAIIDLGNCLNLLDSRYIESVRDAYDIYVEASELAGLQLLTNSGGEDRVIRKLDCAVIRTLHEQRKENDDPSFDTVRAAFFEGQPLYENAGFAEKNHIQVCVRHHQSILGYFRPLDGEGQLKAFK